MKISEWFGTSALASFLRTFGAAILGWVIINSNELDLHPAIVLGLVSALPVLINWLNPNDPPLRSIQVDDVTD
jgi:hypothetical protein